MVTLLIEKLMMWVTATIYGIQVLFEMVRLGFRDGFSKVFHWEVLSRPASLDDPTLGTHGYLQLKEVKIHYVASGPENKPLMLFVHGFPEFWYSWRNQIKEFQKDYRVVAIDQRGYGDSDKPSTIDAYCMKNLISDISQVISALGYKSCVLVAHDWGAAVAWTFGRIYPDMVDRLVIMNVPPSFIVQKLIRTDKKQFKKSWYIFFFQLPYLPELYFKLYNYDIVDITFSGSKTRSHAFSGAFQNPLSKEEAYPYKYIFSQPGAITPPINYYRAALQKPESRVKYDLKYTMPVLVIWGCQDIALSVTSCDLIEAEKNPNITVKRIPEAGHFVQMDTPDLVNKAMREWLDGLPK